MNTLRVVLTVIAGVSVCGTGHAVADSAGFALRYTCSLAPFPDQPMTARITWHAQDSVLVGQASPPMPVAAVATAGAIATQAARMIGATTIEGSVETTATVHAPEGPVPVTVRLTVPLSDIPASGPMNIPATGTTPSVVFHRPGHATITVGSALTLHLIPRNANGDPIGQFLVSCTPDPGQNIVLTSFEITPTAQTPIPTTRSTAGPTAYGAPAATTGPAPFLTAATVPSPPVSGTAQATATSDPTLVTATTGSPAPAPAQVSAVPRAALDQRLVGVGIVVAGAGILGGAAWFLHRRRRVGQGR